MQNTYIDPEELAYNTYHGGHSRSNRRGRVLFPDGKIRSVTLGVPDTFFTIPAHARINGKYVSGFVSVDTHHDPEPEYIFIPYANADTDTN